MTLLKLTDEQARILDNIARRHNASPYSVAMLASEFGPQYWRGCVGGIQNYRPSQGDIDWTAWEV